MTKHHVCPWVWVRTCSCVRSAFCTRSPRVTDSAAAEGCMCCWGYCGYSSWRIRSPRCIAPRRTENKPRRDLINKHNFGGEVNEILVYSCVKLEILQLLMERRELHIQNGAHTVQSIFMDASLTFQFTLIYLAGFCTWVSLDIENNFRSTLLFSSLYYSVTKEKQRVYSNSETRLHLKLNCKWNQILDIEHIINNYIKLLKKRNI